MQAIHFPKQSFRANIRGYTRQPGKGLDACLWRELIQNARDAGATRVDCSLTKTTDHIILKFRDNGCGMDWNTLEAGMLTYGGSLKASGAAGGFGMAKLVVCFSSDETIIWTRDNAVRIDGIMYEKLPDAEYLSGTELLIKCPKSEAPDTRLEPTAEGLRFLLARSDLRGMKVFLDGENIPDCRHDKSEEFVANQFPSFSGTAYYYKRRKPFTSPDGRKVAVLTHRGIWVCDIPVPEDVKGAVLIDSDADPKAVLNDTRTGLSSYSQRFELDRWIGKLNQGVHSTLKTKKFVKRYDGGLFVANKVNVIEAAVQSILTPSIDPAVPKSRGIFLEGKDLKEVVVAAAAKVAEDGGTEKLLERISAMAESIKGTFTGTVEELATTIRQMVWEPALMVINEREQAVDKKFLPESMSPRAKTLLRVWTEVTRQLLIWQGEKRPFGVGFIFSEDTAAAFKQESDGTIWFLVNPCDSKGRITRRLTDKRHVRQLLIDAAHECAHAVVGDETIHGDRFVSALERNLSRVMEHRSKVERVVRDARK